MPDSSAAKCPLARRQHSFLAWLLLIPAFVAGCSDDSKPETPPISKPGRVILISLDTVRQDHLSLYGYPRPTSPRLEGLAEKSVVFSNAMVQAPYTLPSHMTMLTGLHPRAHNVRFSKDKLSNQVRTVAELMKDAGFATAGFADCPYLSPDHGFGRGFDEYDYKRSPGGQRANGFRRYGEDMLSWIDAHAEEPFFLFLHSFDAHGPYVTADPEHSDALAGTEPVVPTGADAATGIEKVRGLRYHEYLGLEGTESLADIIDAYDAGLRFVDEQVGRLLDHLESRGLLDDALIVITSDHGEAFLDHGLYVGHGLTLYEEEVRVPLIVKFPGDAMAGTRSDAIVRSMDITPTILDVARVAKPFVIQGETLVHAARGTDREPRIASGVSPNVAREPKKGPPQLTWYARRGNEKYIDPPRIPARRLLDAHLARSLDGADAYDLETDPVLMQPALDAHYQERLYDLESGEQTNSAGSNLDRLSQIHRWLEEEERNHKVVRETTEDPDMEAILHPDSYFDELVQGGYMSSDEASKMKERNALLRALRAEKAARESVGKPAENRSQE